MRPWTVILQLCAGTFMFFSPEKRDRGIGDTISRCRKLGGLRLRARKQKQRESFSSFYEKKAHIVKASIRVEEEELLEILKSNLLSESRQKLLY